MWYELLPKILNMSLTGGVVILAVLLARLLLRRAPKVFPYALWAVVLFRLLCPVSFSSGFSVFNLSQSTAQSSA
ncbi:MAG: penicillin binding protein, partial [Clostridiales bacterium]|nr:penicillin binding protein [Clostridiales bacterium]